MIIKSKLINNNVIIKGKNVDFSENIIYIYVKKRTKIWKKFEYCLVFYNLFVDIIR